MSSMSSEAKTLLRKINSKKAAIAVVGLGYVGLPLALAFARKGFSVKGIDLDKDRVDKLRRGISYVEDIPSRDLSSLVRQGRFEVFDTYEPVKKADAVVVCVPTPLNKSRDPDLTCIQQASDQIGRRLRKGLLVILESTTYPGTTEELVLPRLERSGFRVGRDFFLCFSPERIDPGNKEFPLPKIPKVVGGVTATCARLASALYEKIIERVFTVSSVRTAEMAKLIENTYRIVNIGLVNELAKAAHALGVNIWEAIDAASTKPFGFMPFYPGPGIGGHCIGVDPVYLSWKARVQGVDIHFIELAREMNAGMPQFVVERAIHTLSERSRKAINGSKILVLGVSYKPDVGDTRESPALAILEELQKLGAKVSYHDPYVHEIKSDSLQLKSEALTPKNLRVKDLVIITTRHSGVNYGLVARHARLVFDTRNVSFPGPSNSKIVRL